MRLACEIFVPADRSRSEVAHASRLRNLLAGVTREATDLFSAAHIAKFLLFSALHGSHAQACECRAIRLRLSTLHRRIRQLEVTHCDLKFARRPTPPSVCARCVPISSWRRLRRRSRQRQATVKIVIRE